MSAATVPESPERSSAWDVLTAATPRDRRHLRRLRLALVAWAVAFLAATLLVGRGALEGTAAVVAAIPAVSMSFVVVHAYVRYLRAADELLRQIHLEGLALGFGAGFVFMSGWRLLERAGAPGLDVNDGLLVMVLFWAAGQWLAARRYS
jgi:hypothetical protein